MDRSPRRLLLLLLLLVVVVLLLIGDSEINAVFTRLLFINCAAQRMPLDSC